MCLNSLRSRAPVQVAARPGPGGVCADEPVPARSQERLLRLRDQQRRAASHGRLQDGVRAHRATGQARWLPRRRFVQRLQPLLALRAALACFAGPAWRAARWIRTSGTTGSAARHAGLVPGSVLPSARDGAHLGRGTVVDGRGRVRVRQFDPEARRRARRSASTSDCSSLAIAGNAMSRVASQIAALGSGYREGGFFIMIGRRRRGRTQLIEPSIGEDRPELNDSTLRQFAGRLDRAVPRPGGLSRPVAGPTHGGCWSWRRRRSWWVRSVW